MNLSRLLGWSLLSGVVLLGVGCGDGCSGSTKAKTTASASASPAPELASPPVVLALDNVAVTKVGPAELDKPIPVLELLPGKGRPELAKVLSIVLVSRDGRRERVVENPLEQFPKGVPVLYRHNRDVSFGVTRPDGGYDATLDALATVEVRTKEPGEAEAKKRTFVLPGKEPVPITDDFLQAVPRDGSALETPGKTQGDGKGSGRRHGAGSGSEEHAGEGAGDGGGGGKKEGDARAGVRLAKLIAHYAKGITVKEVVLTDGSETFVADAKLLADRDYDMRIKFNGEGQLRFRQYEGKAVDRVTKLQLDDVERIEVR